MSFDPSYPPDQPPDRPPPPGDRPDAPPPEGYYPDLPPGYRRRPLSDLVSSTSGLAAAFCLQNTVPLILSIIPTLPS